MPPKGGLVPLRSAAAPPAFDEGGLNPIDAPAAAAAAAAPATAVRLTSRVAPVRVNAEIARLTAEKEEKRKAAAVAEEKRKAEIAERRRREIDAVVASVGAPGPTPSDQSGDASGPTPADQSGDGGSKRRAGVDVAPRLPEAGEPREKKTRKASSSPSRPAGSPNPNYQALNKAAWLGYKHSTIEDIILSENWHLENGVFRDTNGSTLTDLYALEELITVIEASLAKDSASAIGQEQRKRLIISYVALLMRREYATEDKQSAEINALATALKGLQEGLQPNIERQRTLERKETEERFKTLIGTYQAEIAKIKVENTRLTEESKSLQSSLAGLRSLETAINNLRFDKDRAELKAERARAEAKEGSLGALAASNARRDEIVNERVRKMEETLRSYQAGYEADHVRMEQAVAVAAEAKRQADLSKVQSDSYLLRVTGLAEQLAAAQKDAEDAKQRAEELRLKVADSNEKGQDIVDAANARITDLNTKASVAESQIRTLTAQLEAARKTVAEASSGHPSNEGKLREAGLAWENKAIAAENEAKRLAVKLASTDSDLKDSKDEVQSLTKKRIELQTYYTVLSKVVAALLDFYYPSASAEFTETLRDVTGRSTEAWMNNHLRIITSFGAAFEKVLAFMQENTGGAWKYKNVPVDQYVAYVDQFIDNVRQLTAELVARRAEVGRLTAVEHKLRGQLDQQPPPPVAAPSPPQVFTFAPSIAPDEKKQLQKQIGQLKAQIDALTDTKRSGTGREEKPPPNVVEQIPFVPTQPPPPPPPAGVPPAGGGGGGGGPPNPGGGGGGGGPPPPPPGGSGGGGGSGPSPEMKRLMETLNRFAFVDNVKVQVDAAKAGYQKAVGEPWEPTTKTKRGEGTAAYTLGFNVWILSFLLDKANDLIRDKNLNELGLFESPVLTPPFEISTEMTQASVKLTESYIPYVVCSAMVMIDTLTTRINGLVDSKSSAYPGPPQAPAIAGLGSAPQTERQPEQSTRQAAFGQIPEQPARQTAFTVEVGDPEQRHYDFARYFDQQILDNPLYHDQLWRHPDARNFISRATLNMVMQFDAVIKAMAKEHHEKEEALEKDFELAKRSYIESKGFYDRVNWNKDRDSGHSAAPEGLLFAYTDKFSNGARLYSQLLLRSVLMDPIWARAIHTGIHILKTEQYKRLAWQVDQAIHRGYGLADAILYSWCVNDTPFGGQDLSWSLALVRIHQHFSAHMRGARPPLHLDAGAQGHMEFIQIVQRLVVGYMGTFKDAVSKVSLASMQDIPDYWWLKDMSLHDATRGTDWTKKCLEENVARQRIFGEMWMPHLGFWDNFASLARLSALDLTDSYDVVAKILNSVNVRLTRTEYSSIYAAIN